jgi:hypothetical protein
MQERVKTKSERVHILLVIYTIYISVKKKSNIHNISVKKKVIYRISYETLNFL